MLITFILIAVVGWFALLYPGLRRSLEAHVGPLDTSPVVPSILVTVYAFMPLVFVVNRDDGTALLDAGLSASNKVMIGITAVTAFFLLWKVAGERRVLRLPFAMPYLPFTLMIAVNAASALWSIVPVYTLYRATELATLFITTIIVFDRSRIERFLPAFLSGFTLVWLVVTAPTWFASLAHGLVFSAAKNNLMPIVSIALLAHALFLARGRQRMAEATIALVGLVIAGSASSTAALVGLVPAVLVASDNPLLRVLGAILAAACVAIFMVLVVGLGEFPGLLHLVSTVLQKPAEELATATGRTAFWPAIIDGTRDRFFGSGFSAADRFLQLLIPASAFRSEIGEIDVNLASAHNMFLSAWAGTGVLGISLALTVLATAVRWGLKLQRDGRRFVVTFVFVLVLNGLTTPGIFNDWNINVLAFAGVLAFARIGALRAPAPFIWSVAPDVEFGIPPMALRPQGGLPD